MIEEEENSNRGLAFFLKVLLYVCTAHIFRSSYEEASKG